MYCFISWEPGKEGRGKREGGEEEEEEEETKWEKKKSFFNDCQMKIMNKVT